MMKVSWHTVALALVMAVSGPPSHAQDTDDAAIRRLLDRLEKAVQSGNGEAYGELLSPTASTVRAANFTSLELRPGATRVVIQERDRQALRGTLSGNGYRLLVDAFIEFGTTARIATWQLDISRNQKLRDASEAQVFSDVDSAYATLNSNLTLLRPYKQTYLQQAVEVRDTVSFSYQHGGASLLDFLQAQQDYRSVQLNYLNLIGSFLTAANQLNLAVGREVIQ